MKQDPSCLFCKMIAGDIPIDKVAETDDILAFRDINPQAPTHILLIPKEHLPTVMDLDVADQPYMTLLTEQGNQIACQEGLAQNGYRFVVNCKVNGGQEVYHLHMHLLGGRQMTWPPG